MRTITACLISIGLLLNPTIATAQAGIPVQVQALSDVLIELERRAPADVRSLNHATLSAELSGVVKTVYVEEGQSVASGDLLIALDDSDYQLSLQQAEANLQSSKSQKAQADIRLRRARELGANQYLSADELLARETDVMVIDAQIRAQEVSVAMARRNLAKCRVLAPFNGMVQARKGQLGSYVTPGTPLISLVQTDQFELNAEIPDELVASLDRADDIRFVSRNETWPVKLERISSVLDTERRSRKARFSFVQQSAAPAIGRSGELYWHVEDGLLPTSLLVRRDGLLGVFLVEGDRAVFTALANAQEGRPVPVDLPTDARIVVIGRERLQNGDRVVASP